MANFNQILAFWVLSCIVAGAPTVEENCVKIDDFVTQQPTLFVGKNLLSSFHQSKMYCESTQFTECKSMYYVKDENMVRKMKVLRKLMAKQETEEQVGAVSAQFKQYADCPYILQMKWCVYEGLVKDVTEEKKFMNAYFGFEYYIQTFSSQPGKRSVVNYYRENLGILQRLKIWLQMAKAVEELHKKNYIHGSIRPEAFAVLKNDFSIIKMCDLGDAGSETPMKSMSLQFFVPPEGFDRPEARKLAYDVYSLTATFASLELGFQALKNVQDFFQGAENSEKYTSMLCSAIIKEMEINHHSKLDAEQQTVLAKIMTEGLKYDENTRPPIGKVVERIERLINSLEKPVVVEQHSAEHENEEKIEELMRMATVIPDDLNQENDNQVIEEGGASPKKGDENANGAEPAEKHETAEADTEDAHEDKPASEVVEEKPAAEAEVAGTPEKHVSQHRPPIDIDDTDKMVVDTGAKSASLVQEKPMSPIFSDFIDKEKKKRNAKPSEEETEQENIDDFSDASDIADSYNNESPWAFFSVLIIGAFLISASIFYWALD